MFHLTRTCEIKYEIKIEFCVHELCRVLMCQAVSRLKLHLWVIFLSLMTIKHVSERKYLLIHVAHFFLAAMTYDRRDI